MLLDQRYFETPAVVQVVWGHAVWIQGEAERPGWVEWSPAMDSLCLYVHYSWFALYVTNK